MPSGLDEDADVEEGPVLSPEELDISNDERVKEIDDGRYVVSSGGPVSNQQSEPAGELESGPSDSPARDEYKTGPNPAIEQNDDPTPLEAPPNDEPEPPAPSDSLDARSVHNWLSDDLQAANSEYAFDITANFGGDVSQQRMVSNDVVTTFETLVMWYAQQVDRNTPVEQVLGILLMEANVPVRYPPKAIRRALKSTSLSADDTIADLMREVKENQGLQL
ncbi:hypothetical protein ACFR9U_13405 [Halorientalis brevis]|uniref:DIX domain-containing protein n=1 Tax=Halorientalis brevis TaxID=1126241 RepID=A0ABD6CF09_9EURY|nr:hypothetical protein [Halorientalis brevis]